MFLVCSIHNLNTLGIPTRGQGSKHSMSSASHQDKQEIYDSLALYRNGPVRCILHNYASVTFPSGSSNTYTDTCEDDIITTSDLEDGKELNACRSGGACVAYFSTNDSIIMYVM